MYGKPLDGRRAEPIATAKTVALIRNRSKSMHLEARQRRSLYGSIGICHSRKDLRPVRMDGQSSREDFVQAPRAVRYQPETQPSKPAVVGGHRTRWLWAGARQAAHSLVQRPVVRRVPAWERRLAVSAG